MSSWVALLVALTACLRFGGAQSEPLPHSLVDLVMNSPISSMEELHKLLDVDSVEEEADEGHSNGTHRRLPRSLGVQVAQQAMCKVRTEVMEVTRSMLDRRNANFLLWPLCVEVQRCSGCCNSRNMQCVPVTKEMRHLQMTKIQFINRQPIYEKVVIPVEDHVTCSCQSRTAAPAPAPAPRAKATPPPPRVLPKVIPPPSQSKEELHRHDDLKQNQRLHLDDREAQQWQPKYAPSHTQGAPVHTPTRTQSNRPAPFQPLLTYTPAVPAHAGREDTWTQRATPGTLDGHTHRQPEPERAGEHRTHLGSGDSKSELHHHQHHGHHRHNSRFQSDEATPQLPHRNLSHDSSQSGGTVHHHSQSEVVPPHSSQLEGSVLTYTHVEVIGQSSGQSKLPGRHFAQIVTPSIHSSPLEVGSQPHSQSVHAEHQEKSSKLQRHHEEKSDMEREQKQSEHHHHHHHQNQNQTQATGHHQASTHRAVTNAPPTMSPTPQPPPPPTTQRRRRRKHRRRMSKSAMRAMIMVMS
ncbi:bromodomain-containing protein 4B isoform X2 [Electrophorus electricus]|uniref:bromodomain-containing protein 4B isoform X2 n=1 Tax=Electrophorus electricus TaxID=8005 RepID=UPI0015D06A2C|nr:bromodomain-containing protein 4B isoform X2 [Electrophorus electricus]